MTKYIGIFCLNAFKKEALIKDGATGLSKLCLGTVSIKVFFSRKRRRAAPQYIKKKKGGKKSLQYTKLQIGGSVATLNKAS